MSGVGHPTRSSGGSWKNRFNAKQLERKRLSDRLNQRRTRKQTKEYVTELEKRVELLSRGDHAAVISQLIEENNNLRASLNRSQTKMDTVLLCTKNFLEEGDDDKCGPEVSVQHMLPQTDRNQPSLDGNDATEKPRSSAPNLQYLNMAYHHMNEPPSFTASIIFQAAKLVLPTDLPSPATKLTKQEWLQSILMWKIVESHGQDYSFLLSHFSLDKEPVCLSVEQIEKAVQIPHFDSQILECLLEGKKFPDILAGSSENLGQEPLNDYEKQRRCTMFCALELIISWYRFYNSPVESGLVFWAIFRYFMLLIFPTDDNFQMTPNWLIPTPSQLSCEHPGFIDFLMWPDLRERLSTTWGHYDEQKLVLGLIENFELDSKAQRELGLAFPLELDLEDQCLQLKPQFKPVLDNIHWFKTKPDFARNFPDLMPFVIPQTAHVSKVLSGPGLSGQDVVFTSETWCRMTETHANERLDLDASLSHMAASVPWLLSEPSNILHSLTFNTVASPLDGLMFDSVLDQEMLSHHYPIPASDGNSDDGRSSESTKTSQSSRIKSPCIKETYEVSSLRNLAGVNEAYAEFCATFAPFPPFCPPQ